MASTRNLFREYTAWRARVVVYVAIALSVLGLFGLGVLIADSADNITRFGLLLQVLGIAFTIPHVVGKHRFGWLRLQNPRPVVPVTAGLPRSISPAAGSAAEEGEPPQHVDGEVSQEPPAGEPAPVEAAAGSDLLTIYQSDGREMLLGNLLASLGLIGLLVSALLWPEQMVFENEVYARALLSLAGFAWLNLLMLMLIYRMFHTTVPRGMLAGFVFIDFLVGFVGVVFAGIIHIFEAWLGGGVRFTFQNGFRRVLMLATLPFLLTGLGLEMLATFFP